VREPVDEAFQKLHEHRATSLPVFDSAGGCSGTISVHNLEKCRPYDEPEWWVDGRAEGWMGIWAVMGALMLLVLVIAIGKLPKKWLEPHESRARGSFT
jgi:hypothetical protein